MIKQFIVNLDVNLGEGSNYYRESGSEVIYENVYRVGACVNKCLHCQGEIFNYKRVNKFLH